MGLRNDKLTSAINELLDKDRDAQGLTNEAHAERLGISIPTYYRLRRGQIHKSAAVLVEVMLRRPAPSEPTPLAA